MIQASGDFTIIEATAKITTIAITGVEAVVRCEIRSPVRIRRAVIVRRHGIVAIVVVDHGFGYGRLLGNAAENAIGMAAEHRPDALEQERATRDPGRGRRRRPQKARTALHDARKGRLRIIGPDITALGLTLTIAPLTITGRRAGRGRRWLSPWAGLRRNAEPAGKSTKEAGRLLRPGRRLGKLLFQIGDPRLRLIERYILDQHGLDKLIRGIRLLRDGLADQRLRLTVLWLAACLLQPIHQRCDQVFFLRCHRRVSRMSHTGSNRASDVDLTWPLGTAKLTIVQETAEVSGGRHIVP